jgi:peptide/nickel transport system substrate-binding protein
MMDRTRHTLVGLGIVGTIAFSMASISYYEEAMPSTLNPLFARSMVDYRSHELIFDRLYHRSPITNELVSRVIESDEILQDGSMLRVTLKKGVRWHDNKKLSADDLCFTINALLNPKTPSTLAQPYRESIKSCVTENKQTALITFTKVYPNPRERVSVPILPESAFGGNTAVSPDHPFASQPIGTGPMKAVKTRRVVTFDAFSNDHVLSEGGDPFVQVRTVINAGIQGVIQVGPALRAEVAASDDVALKSYDLRSWWFLAMNTANPALKQKDVRKAVHLTLDRNELRELTIGVDPKDKNPPCEFVSGPFIQSSPYYNRQIPLQETHDRAKARALMEKAGATETAGRWTIGGKPITLKVGMHAPLDAEARDLLSQLANQLSAGGFDAQVARISTEDWQQKVISGQAGKEFDAVIGKWSFGTVEDVNPLFHSRQGSKGSLNIFNYSNPEVDKLLARWDVAKTDTEARDAYHELHALLADELPYAFLWKLDTKSAWRMEIKNNTIAPFFYFTNFDGWQN